MKRFDYCSMFDLDYHLFHMTSRLEPIERGELKADT